MSRNNRNRDFRDRTSITINLFQAHLTQITARISRSLMTKSNFLYANELATHVV